MHRTQGVEEVSMQSPRQLKSDSLAGYQRNPAISIRVRSRLFGLAALAFFMALVAVRGAAQVTPQPLNNPPPAQHSILLPEANRLPDANDQMEMRDQANKSKDYTAANAERRKQIADDTAKLLKLAADLKAEVDKTSKDTLSLGVIRKADEIERLAHSVKEKMKLSVGGLGPAIEEAAQGRIRCAPEIR
jgi:hypothetical protein